MLVSLIFVSYWQVFATQKVQAADPPAPRGGSDYFRYAGAENNGTGAIFGDYYSGSTLIKSYNFQHTADTTADKVQNASAIKDMQHLWVYTLDTGSNAYLIVGSHYSNPSDPNNADFNTYFCGLYYHAYTTPDLFTPITGALVGLGTGHFTTLTGTNINFAPAGTDDPNAYSFVTAAISKIGANIHSAGSITDQCNNLSPLWTQYVTDFSLLFKGDPKSNSTYWQIENQNQTSVAGSAWKSFKSSIITGNSDPWIAAFGGAAGASIRNWAQQFTTGYELKSAGIDKANSMRNSAKTMQGILQTIIDSNQGQWPTPTCAPGLLDQNWTVSLNDRWATPKAMYDYLGTIIKMFEGLMGSYGAPAGAGVCGNLISSATGNFMTILYGMLCGVASLIHDASTWAMTRAKNLLQEFVGVEVPSISFKNPAQNYIDKTTGAVTGTQTGNTSPATTISGNFKVSSTATAAQKAKVVAFIAALHDYKGTLSGKIAAEKKDASGVYHWQGESKPITISVSNFSADNSSFDSSITYPQDFPLGTADLVGIIISFTDSSGQAWTAAFGATVNNGKIIPTFGANDASGEAPSVSTF